MGILSLPISLRNELTSMARLAPWSFFPLIKLRQRLSYAKWMLFDPTTEFVIEGYFRCANSFAYRAFHYSQDRKAKTASHTHAAATVIRAVKQRVPTLVLIREPADAVASRCIKHPHVSVAHALRDYSRFYQTVKAYSDHFVVADFGQVISDFGDVIRRVNEKFQTDFGLFDHTKEHAQRVRDMGYKDDFVVGASNRPLPVSAREEKRKRVESLLSEVAMPHHARRLARADRLYHDFLPLTRNND